MHLISENAQHSRGLSSRCVTTTRRAGLAGDQLLCTIPAKKHYLPLIAKDGTAPTALTASPCGSAIVMRSN